MDPSKSPRHRGVYYLIEWAIVIILFWQLAHVDLLYLGLFVVLLVMMSR